MDNVETKKITKTIIKGQKQIIGFRLEYEPDGEPIIKSHVFKTEISDKVIDEVDYDLHYLTNSNSYQVLYLSPSCLPTIDVLVNGELKTCRVVQQTEQDGVKTIVVDEVIEAEEQDYLSAIIQEEYEEKYIEYARSLENKLRKSKEIIDSFQTADSEYMGKYGEYIVEG